MFSNCSRSQTDGLISLAKMKFKNHLKVNGKLRYFSYLACLSLMSSLPSQKLPAFNKPSGPGHTSLQKASSRFAGLGKGCCWPEMTSWIMSSHAKSFCPASLCGYGTCSLEGQWSRITQLEIKARSLDSWFSYLSFTLWSPSQRRDLIRCCWKNEWVIVLIGIQRVLVRWAWLRDLNSYSLHFGTLQP